MNYKTRRELLARIEEARNSKAILYVTGDRPGQEAHIGSDALDYFAQHLDKIGVVDRISLILYTTGGDIMAARSIANLLRMYCDTLEVIVPSKCFSAGTLLCLGADSVIMTKQALLGPIDPTVVTILGPRLPVEHGGTGQPPIGVSVEDINGYMNQARESLPNQTLDSAFDRLAVAINPLVIGSAFRARAQIRMLGQKLLSVRMNDEAKVDKILDFLCSDSGSHDYTINRREAEEDLGLPIEKPSWELFGEIRAVYDSFASEMHLLEPLDVKETLGSNREMVYHSIRVLIESADFGTHRLVGTYRLTKIATEVHPGITSETGIIERLAQAWRFQDATD